MKMTTRISRALALMLSIVATASAFRSTTSTSLSLSRRKAARHALYADTTADPSTAETVKPADPGWIKTVNQQGNGQALQLGDIATVKYSCYVQGQAAPFSASTSQKVVVGDDSFIDGWNQALRSMQIGEQCTVRITDPALGYGSAGFGALVPPNAVIDLELQVLTSQPPTLNIDFDTLAAKIDNATPRTPADIQAAFEARQQAKASGEPAPEGLEAFIEKAKNFYFFGLFEGETGERPPWFLRPSITFPLAFAVVGAAFYITFQGGGITERGAQVTDELDEIILSSSSSSAPAPPATTMIAAMLLDAVNLPL